MIKCRACLIKSENLVLLDEQSVSTYNVLTNLNARRNDGLPQYLCKLCYNTIGSYEEFRNKCIAVDTFLKSNILEVKYERTNEEDSTVPFQKDCYNDNVMLDYKENLKHEPDDFDNNIIYEEEYINDVKSPMNINYVDEYDTKQKRRKSPRQKKKIIQNTRLELKNITKLVKKPLKILKQNTQLTCGLCPMNFENNSLFKEHLIKHGESKKCTLCSENFKDCWQTLAHQLVHIKDPKQKCCHICHKKYRKPLFLEYHYKKIHSKEENILLECDKCERKYSNPLQLRKHKWEIHSDHIFICDHCNKICYTKSKLRIHMILHLTNKQYTCKLCNYSCKYRNNLKNHALYKHTDKANKVYCKICTAWKGVQEFDKHKCKPRKLQICPVCGKEMYSNRIRRHMATHSSTLQYKCDRCPSAYKTKTALQVHTDRHDGFRRYKCEYCPMAFYSIPVITKHRRIHTGIKPYVCVICQKAFTGKHNLKVHMRVHGEDLIVKKTDDDKNISL